MKNKVQSIHPVKPIRMNRKKAIYSLKNKILIGVGLISFLLYGCSVKSGEQDTSSGNEPLPPEPNKVEIMLLEKSDFYREIVSNGKLSAIEKAGLFFRSSGTIEKVNVRNGNYIEAGTEICKPS